MANKEINCNQCKQASIVNCLCGYKLCIQCLFENVYNAKSNSLEGIVCPCIWKNNLLRYDDIIPLLNNQDKMKEMKNNKMRIDNCDNGLCSHLLFHNNYSILKQMSINLWDDFLKGNNDNNQISLNSLNEIINRMSCKLRDNAKESIENITKVIDDMILILIQFKEKKIIEINKTQKESELFLMIIKLLYEIYYDSQNNNRKSTKSHLKQNYKWSLPIIKAFIKPSFDNDLVKIKEELTLKLSSLTYDISFNYEKDMQEQTEKMECIRILNQTKKKESNKEVFQNVSPMIQLKNQEIITSTQNSYMSVYNINNFPTYEFTNEHTIDNNSTITSLIQLTQNKLLVSGSADSKIRLYEKNCNGVYQCIYTDQTHRDSITCLIELNVDTLCASGLDSTLRLFKIESNSLISTKTIYTKGYINTIIKLRQPDKFAYGTSLGELNIWNPINYSLLPLKNITNDLIHQIIELIDERIVLCSRNNGIKIIKNNKEQFDFGSQSNTAISICEANNEKLMSSTLEKTICVWKLNQNMPPICQQVIPISNIALKIIQLSNGLLISHQSNNSLILWEA